MLRQRCLHRKGVLLAIAVMLFVLPYLLTLLRGQFQTAKASRQQKIPQKFEVSLLSDIAQTTVPAHTSTFSTFSTANLVPSKMYVPAAVPRSTITRQSDEFSAIRAICQSNDTSIISARKYDRDKYASPMLELTNFGMRYCPIAKSGSTLWKRIILYLRRANVSPSQTKHLEVDCDPDVERETLHSCADTTLTANRQNVVGEELNATLIVVRDPWQRLVSGYVDKMVHQKSDFTRDCYYYHSVSPATANLSFSQFVDCVLNGKASNWHFSPQFGMCDFCDKAATASSADSRLAIVHLENLPESFASWLRFSGYNDTYVQLYQEAYRNASRSSRPSSERGLYIDMYAQLSDDRLKGLEAKYRLDAEAFGYNVSIPRTVERRTAHQ